MKKRGDNELAFEDSLSDDWSRDIKVAEVPIGNRPLLYLGVAVFAVALAIAGQVLYLNFAQGSYYEARAIDNVLQAKETAAPRGEILDREGDVLAESKAAFAAVLDARAFLRNSSPTSTQGGDLQTA